jgi:hypothetical protein
MTATASGQLPTTYFVSRPSIDHFHAGFSRKFLSFPQQVNVSRCQNVTPHSRRLGDTIPLTIDGPDVALAVWDNLPDFFLEILIEQNVFPPRIPGCLGDTPHWAEFVTE